MAFVKGDPRINRKGRLPGQEGAMFLRKHLKDNELARIIAEKARGGNELCIRLSAEYLWGKPLQTVKSTGEITVFRAELPYRKAAGAPVNL